MPDPVCQGESVILTASGGGPFSWSTGDTTASVTVSPDTTTTYTVIRTEGGCVSPPVSVTVKILPAPVANAGPDKSLCSDSVAIGGYPPSGGTRPYTYAWSPAGGLSCTSCLNPMARPATTTAYVLTVTDSAGCAGRDTVLLTVLPGCCTGDIVLDNDSSAFNPKLGGGTVSGKTIYIKNTFTVNSPLTFSGCRVIMASGSLINISGFFSSLTLEGSSHVHACDSMWEGIYVRQFGQLTVKETSSIEDAENAIVSIQGGRYTIEAGSVLNKNYKAIVVRPWPGTHTGTVKETFIGCDPSAVPGITWPGPYLRPPRQNQRASTGVEIRNVNDITIGSSATPNPNIFYNMDAGISALRGNVKVYNNLFITDPSGNTQGTAIIARGQAGIAPVFTYTLTAGGAAAGQKNTFSSCYNGIRLTRNMHAGITGNAFSDIANTGIYAAWHNNNNNIAIFNNTMERNQTAVYCYRNALATFDISGNIIDAQGLPNSTGVQIQELFASPSSHYTVSNNDINNVRYGINATGLSGALIDDNTVYVQPAPNPADYCAGILTSNTNTSRISNNRISSAGKNHYWTDGIRVEPASYNNEITCNETYNLGSGLFFSGTQLPGTFVAKNSMSANNWDLLLNYGTIGQQGSPGLPNDNQWAGGASDYHSYAYYSDGTQSPFYVQPTAAGWAYNPNPYLAGAFPGTQLIQFITTTGNLDGYQCALVPTRIEPASMQEALRIAGDSIPYPAFEPESRYAGKWNLYRYLQTDSLLTASSALLQQFRENMALSNTGNIEKVSGILSDPSLWTGASLLQAALLNSSFFPQNNIEANQKEVHAIIVSSYLAGQVDSIPFSTSQLNTLRDIAVRCPLTDGPAVYTARVLLAQSDSIIYTNHCEQPDRQQEYFKQGEQNTSPAFALQPAIKVYPNPANTALTVEAELKEKQQGLFELYTLTGVSVVKHILLDTNGITTINLASLKAGMYYYRISIGHIIVETDKLVIVR